MKVCEADFIVQQTWSPRHLRQRLQGYVGERVRHTRRGGVYQTDPGKGQPARIRGSLPRHPTTLLNIPAQLSLQCTE